MNKYYEALNYLNEIALGDNEFTEDIEVKEEMKKRRDLAYTTLKELLDNHKGGVKFEDIRRVGELRAQHEKVTDNLKQIKECSGTFLEQSSYIYSWTTKAWTDEEKEETSEVIKEELYNRNRKKLLEIEEQLRELGVELWSIR